ncbi:MAG: hydrolase [Candidatus Saccharibacteria bacterium]|nr:hydrolase [Candidatus Saccharibacteria bacterium]
MKKLIPKDVNLIPDSAKLVFKGEIYDIYQWEQELYGGSFKTFEMGKRCDTVNVFAIVDGEIILLEDEQPHRKMLLALPGGHVDDTDSSILEAAKRELVEEAGYSLQNWKLIDVVKPIEKLEWFIHTFIAYGTYEKTDQHIDAGERIKVMHKSFEEIKSLAEAGEERLIHHLSFLKNKTLEEFIATPEFEGIEVDR